MSYADKLAEEIRTYRDVQDVHDLPPIYHYWSHKYLCPKFQTLGFDNPNAFYLGYIRSIASKPAASCRILSLGAGNCDTEVELACILKKSNTENFIFDCLDINSQMLVRGEQLALKQGVADHFRFLESDINSWRPAGETYDVVIANQSLHHFVELELLFQKTYDALAQHGYFLTNDMIGRNGHMRWPEALELVQAFWSLLDDKHKWNHQLHRTELVYENWDCSIHGGFEGIRSQDVLPLLIKTFHFERFIGFANIITVFIDRGFGHNFDVHNFRDCYFIDFVAQLDDYFIELGKLKPTQMIAAMTKTKLRDPEYYKGLSPEWSIRRPTSTGAQGSV